MTDADRDLLALSIQQPWAELILRGVKTIEIRKSPARPQGPVYLYASRKPSTLPGLKGILDQHGISPETLPRGVLVGTVEILECRRARIEDAAGAGVPADFLADHYSWILGRPMRFSQPLQPLFVPFGTWFYPFKRMRTNTRHRSQHGGV